MVKIEIAHAEHQRILLLPEHQIDTGCDIIGSVLVVAVDRYGALRIRAVLQKPLPLLTP